ncbi:DUF3769 domain-containing protein [Lyngbya aestuarii]|uniref:DUF3769 domain-containing protein n=1 Tax=Lyngbya aestuarii TaxID=118322 RepID=UPI00403E2815
MPQPVQPPEIPAIVRYISSEELAILDDSSRNISGSLKNQPLATTPPSTPIPSESFVPNSSLLTTAQNAAALGPPISLGYSLQSASEVSYHLHSSTTTASLRQSKRMGEEHSSPLKDDYTQAELSATSSTPIVDNAYIHFHLRNQATVPKVQILLTQERGGEVREFEFNAPQPTTQPSPEQEAKPALEEGEAAPQPSPVPESETTVPTNPLSDNSVIELTADRQEYDEQRQIITAEGNVVLRFQGALVDADRLQVNLPNRIIVAEGNVALTREGQVLRGERFEYYFVQDSGVVLNASGEVYPATEESAATPERRLVSDRITSNQPLQGITNPGGYSFGFGASVDVDSETGATQPSLTGLESGGNINRLRYQADRIDFEGKEAIATNVRITNDPFSPPELELRANTARFRRIAPLVDEVVASKPRIVFDQGFSLPTFRNRIVIDRREREPSLFNIGFDDDDRGGLFIERGFNLISNPNWRLKVTPQYFVQKAIFGDSDGDGGGVINPSAFGLKARLDGTFSPRTTLVGSAVLTSLDPGELEDEARASVRLRQVIGTSLPHNLNLEYSYRDRLFNGSLGFQTVQSSLGAVITSPVIPLGRTGINLNYQAGVQLINARTDQRDLLGLELFEPFPENYRVNLTRYQGTATLSKAFLLWQGQALPATATEGLRYTPAPVTPYLALSTIVSGVGSAYSNGDTQESLSGTIGIVGQLGHFSRRYFDFTGFNLSYTKVALGNLSPFLFDRVADSSVLSGGITQQIYGPFRVGFQTSLNLETGDEISTDLFVEYSRRTYNILLRYNPVQQLASINLRINDFNWTGNPGLFDGSEVRPVIQGVTQ